jgi:archaeal flagellar protein FlaJ
LAFDEEDTSNDLAPQVDVPQEDQIPDQPTTDLRSEPELSSPADGKETIQVESSGQEVSLVQSPPPSPPKKRKVKGGKRGKQSDEEDEFGFRKVEGQKQTFNDKLINFALRSTRPFCRILADRMPKLHEDILKSNLNLSPEGIIALSLLFTYVSVPFAIFGAIELAALGFVLEAIFVPFALAIPLLLGISIPKVSASSRSSAVDNEIPYVVGYISVLAGGGISPFVTLKRLAKAGDIFPACSKEAKKVLLLIEIFGLDAISALEQAAKNSPNKVWADLLGGYTAVLRTGGDASNYLESKLKDVFSYREQKIKAGSEFTGMMAEAYIIVTVVMGVALYTLFATQNLMSSGVTSVDPTMILLFAGLMVPIISIVFIVVLGSSQVREPFSFDKPIYVLLACTPIAAIFYFLPLGLPIYMQLGIGLILTSTPAAIIQHDYVAKKRAVEAKLSNFLRDISEVRRTGLAPEKTIEQLADRDYGGLAPHVKKISTQLAWGVPIRQVLQDFSHEVQSWVTRVIAFLLLEVVDVGGGSPKMFIDLADFTEKNAQLDKQRRSEVRPYVIIPYIGAILMVATTAMMVYFVNASAFNPGSLGIAAGQTSFGAGAGLPTPQVAGQLASLLLTASFFQSWVMGFVAGKMGEGSVSDGLKHATLLVLIGIITVIFAQVIFGL